MKRRRDSPERNVPKEGYEIAGRFRRGFIDRDTDRFHPSPACEGDGQVGPVHHVQVPLLVLHDRFPLVKPDPFAT